MTIIDRRYSVAEGTAVKAPVLVATTASITLSGLQSIDGVTVAEHDRVLVKDQTDQTTNGIYEASTGNWRRAKDFDGAFDVVDGTRVLVSSGSVNPLREFVVTTADPITIGTSNIVFTAREPGIGVAATGRVLRPEQFGLAGLGNASIDTACFAAMWAAMSSNYTAILDGDYKITGQSTIPALSNIAVVVNGTVRQQSKYAKTFYVSSGSVNVKFYGSGTMYGYAQIDIDASRAPTELLQNGGVSLWGTSHNGTVGIYFDTVTRWEVYGLTLLNHCGWSIGGLDGNYYKIHHCCISGVGSTYLTPTPYIDFNDFGISVVPSVTGQTAVQFELDYSHNTIINHGFGIRAVLTKSCVIQGNTMGPFPLQHGIYGTECEGILVTGNRLRSCNQIGIKFQLENYAGTVFGSAWASGGTYVVGNLRRYNSILYECIINVSGSATTPAADTTHWVISTQNRRTGGIIADNVIEDSLSGVGMIASSLAYATENYTNDIQIKNNIAINPRGDAFILHRCINSVFEGNTCNNATRAALVLNHFSGRITNNNLRETVENGLYGYIAADTLIEGNRWQNNGITASATIPKYPVYLAEYPTGPGTDTGIPSLVSAFPNPTIDFKENEIRFSTGDAASTEMAYFDLLYQLYVRETRTNSAKNFRVNGTVLSHFRNQFSSFDNSAQNAPAYTSSNVTTRRSWDANAADAAVTLADLKVVVADLADVVGTLLSDLRTEKRVL